MLAAAAVLGPRAVRGDLCRLPFRDAAFDGTHAAYALQNVPDWRAAVGEVCRATRPGGRVLVAWGGPHADRRVSGLEQQYYASLGAAAGVLAEGADLTLDAAAAAAIGQALAWAQSELGPLDVPLELEVHRTFHVYGA